VRPERAIYSSQKSSKKIGIVIQKVSGRWIMCNSGAPTEQKAEAKQNSHLTKDYSEQWRNCGKP
jgi:hypothetical protein